VSVLPKRQELPAKCPRCENRPGPRCTFEYAPTHQTGCHRVCDQCRAYNRANARQQRERSLA
jgi:hypothetical protein